MEALILDNRRFVAADRLPDDAYLYQTIHTLGHRGRRLDRHLAIVADWSRRLFGCEPAGDEATLRQGIGQLLGALHYPTAVSSFVGLRYYASGQLALLPGEISLYAGYNFRSLHPSAIGIRYELPFDGAPLSTREHAAMTARRMAEAGGARCALRIDADGRLRSCDDAPLFAVCGQTIYTPEGPNEVAFDIAAEAIERRGYRLRRQEIDSERIEEIDELFYVDHRGLTSLSRYRDRVLMHVVAEQVASRLER